MEQKRAYSPLPFKEIAFFLLSSCLAAMFLAFGKTGWPGLHWDAAIFGTPVINVARDQGWLWGSYTPFIIIRDSLTYNIHGLLHVLLYGALFKTQTWSDYLFAMGIINALTFACYASIYAVLLARRGGAGWKTYGGAILLGTIPGLICLGLQGRPEQVIPLVLTLPLLAGICGAKPSQCILVSGLTLSLVAIASPLPGAVYLLALLVRYGILSRNNWRHRLGSVAALLALTAAFGSLLIGGLTPFSGVEWVRTVLDRRSETLNLGGLLHGPADWGGWTLVVPGWSVLMIFFIISGLAAIWRRREHRLIVILILVAAWIVLNQKMADYSYVPFLPYAIAIGLMIPEELLLPRAATEATRKLYQNGMIGLGGLYALVLGWFLLASLLLPPGELSPAQARQTFLSSEAGKALKNEKNAVGYPFIRWPSMGFLGEADDRLISLHIRNQPERTNEIDLYEAKTGHRVSHLVFPQSKAGRNPCPPPETIFVGRIPFSLLEHNWHCPKPTAFDRLAGPTPLANRYSFAIYRRSANP